MPPPLWSPRFESWKRQVDFFFVLALVLHERFLPSTQVFNRSQQPIFLNSNLIRNGRQSSYYVNYNVCATSTNKSLLIYYLFINNRIIISLSYNFFTSEGLFALAEKLFTLTNSLSSPMLNKCIWFVVILHTLYGTIFKGAVDKICHR